MRIHAVALGVAVVAVAVGAPAVAYAGVSAPAAQTPASRTCSAFRTWNAHRTAQHLDALVTASFPVKWKYLGEDAIGLYSDVREGAEGAGYVAKDVKYFTQDCDS